MNLRHPSSVASLLAASAALCAACAGTEAPACQSHAALYCLDGAVAWLNSCGGVEEVVEACAQGCRPDGAGCLGQAPAVAVSVTPAQVEVALGASLAFAAVVAGADAAGVLWAVEEGAAHGTVSQDGVYKAPARLPSPPIATVRATSVANPAVSGSAVVTLVDSSSTVSSSARTLVRQAFDMPASVAAEVDELIGIAAQAVWAASETSGQPAFTGTLTQAGAGSEAFTYVAGPDDCLRVVFADGVVLELRFHAFDGYVDGTWEDFLPSHDVDVSILVQDKADLRVVSSARPEDPGAYTWQRAITGWYVDEAAGGQVTVDLTTNGREYAATDWGWSEAQTWEQVAGTATSLASTLTVSQYRWVNLIHRGDIGQILRNWELRSDSAVTLGGVTYAFVSARARWECGTLINDPAVINVVVEPDYWIAEGLVTRDGVPWGQVAFDGPVSADTWGPELVLRLGTGEQLLLHPLIEVP